MNVLDPRPRFLAVEGTLLYREFDTSASSGTAVSSLARYRIHLAMRVRFEIRCIVQLFFSLQVILTIASSAPSMFFSII